MLGGLGGILIVFGTPVIFVVALFIRFRDKSKWSKAALVISSVTFALWLLGFLFEGFS
jgi:hypothetical protein